ncbi:MAG: hypothetical protein KKD63_04025 [Proteobacteria bacterium]|nr:hypothetical protein [Desulfobulbaceae bacterium]MBU4152029.1 hypothetical protein [Pseudomonadota bacterium]MDP2106871.1 hypothetical protein [Desulfobulbaceae bacterium]
MKIGIIGAGTLAAFIVDIIRRLPGFDVLGQFDERYPEITLSNGVPVLGKVEDVKPGTPIALGIGSPAARKVIYERKRLGGFVFPSIIDPSCVISGSASIGDGVIIGPFSTVLAGSVVHNGACLLSHVNVNQNVSIGAFSLIGAGALIGNGAFIGTGAHVGLGGRVALGGRVEDWADAGAD